MNIIKVDCLPLSIFVGYERENDARGVTFDYSAWAEKYGDGVLQLLVQRPGDADPYPVVLTAGENNTAVWLLSATDTAVKGWLETQLIFTVGSVVAKTAVLPVLVDRSLAAGGTPPDPYETWLETLTELAEQILHTTQPPEIRNGYWYIFDPDTGEYVNSGVKAEGEDGVGITGAQLNADYTLTLSFSDGTSYTTPSIRGAQGEPGPTPQLSIGTVTTGAAGSSAAVEISGTPEAPKINFTIPRGDTGEVSEAELQAALLDKADVITDTASGAIASFPDGAAAPVKALTVAVEPVQDLHGYDAPWPSGGGKNKFNGSFQRGYYAFADGSFAISDYWLTTYKIPCRGNTYYTASASERLTRWQGFVWFDENNSYISTTNLNDNRNIGYSAQSPANAAYLVFNIAGYPGTTSPILPTDVTKFQIEEGRTATAWTPYSNICPITGHTGADVVRTGKNLLSPHLYTGMEYNPTIGATVTLADNPVQLTDNGDGTFSLTTTQTWQCYTIIVPVKSGISYAVSYGFSSTGQGGRSWGYLDKDFKVITKYNSTDQNASYSSVWQPQDGAYMYFVISNRGTASATITVTNPQVEIGSSASTYESYRGQPYHLPFGQTVYSGQFDVVEGKMYARPYYPSYNGETLVGPWISSMDKYEEGATPTTGAQVVDMGGAVTEISLTPEEIETLKGTNNFWSDAGDVSVEYRADTKLYIEKKITAAIAAALNS